MMRCIMTQRALRLVILLATVALLVAGCSPSPAPEPAPKPAPAPVADAHADLIRVSAPLANTVVTSPLVVSGEARGVWYFEASFPVRLLDVNGSVLAQVPAQAQGEWMTREFVPFKATLTFSLPTNAIGTLVLQKDNPSGLPEHGDSISIPVRFFAPNP